MNIISAVANLQKELDYYKEAYQECKAVIRQLTDGPNDVEYIHPYDYNANVKYAYPSSKVHYKLSVHMPITSKNPLR